jgi:hypothetical protein
MKARDEENIMNWLMPQGEGTVMDKVKDLTIKN